MVKKSKLKSALLAEKGIDLKKLQLKKKEKIAKKARAKKNECTKPLEVAMVTDGQNDNLSSQKEPEKTIKEPDVDNDESNGESSCEEDENPSKFSLTLIQVDLEAIDESESDSSNGEEEDDEDIPVSDLEDLDDDEREDIIPHQRLTIDNIVALTSALKRIAVTTPKLQFSEHLSITTSTPVSIPDVSDDLNRELAFYSQCLSAAQEARKLLKCEGIPFSRPKDYFAEMVKADEHMAKIKSKLIDEAASKKASAEARKQRDLKKFGKQVQVAKLQERDKERKQTLEKIKVLKRKRQGAEAETTNEADLFDVAIDEEIGTSKPSRKDRPVINKRQKKDEKFGFGGKKKFKKSGDAISSGDLKKFSSKKMKSDPKSRPGKSRRASKR
ncbi:BgTH12-06907 [Blumeria graminis f. sp. triticale]|uniref:BgTH12-06906 n=1 Tax=Blumeria graminis f. sp. triticale TaxID=1689686 RepID=A0A9W4D6W8_BLUGR|nr:BgTH12-06906 [Blumeria graminis f. sp. triticale]CAD6505975.1 BgTH12-06907 [Blumeria graminis f. sp. triticale]